MSQLLHTVTCQYNIVLGTTVSQHLNNRTTPLFNEASMSACV